MQYSLVPMPQQRHLVCHKTKTEKRDSVIFCTGHNFNIIPKAKMYHSKDEITEVNKVYLYCKTPKILSIYLGIKIHFEINGNLGIKGKTSVDGIHK